MPATLEAPPYPTSIESPPYILVVDDERDVADSYAEVLELHGFDVQVAYGAAEAAQLAEERIPDIVFTDIAMPGGSGWGLCTQLRGREETRHSLIVAVTAYGLEMHREISAVSGFDVHLVKPVPPEAMLKLIHQWWG